MRTLIASLAVVVLVGCASPIELAPYIQDITDPVALARDKKECGNFALAFHEPLSASRIGTSAAKGAASNAAGAAVSPFVPVLGAAGGALTTTLDEIGVLNGKQRRVYLRCLDHRGERSHAYMVVDPDL